MSQTFARKLKFYRTALGMTQTDLAKSADLTRSAINNYEAAKSEPNFEALCKISAILGVSLPELIYDDDIPDYTRRLLVTDEESAMLQLFREADEAHRAVAINVLKL